MKAAVIENWRFGRREAAELVGMTSGQLGNYLTRYDLFQGRGKGHHFDFALRDLLTVSAVKALIEMGGLTPEQAAMALRGIAGPYGVMLHDGWGPLGHCPGTLAFTRNTNGRWRAVDGFDKAVSIQIRAWPLFDDLWPRVRAKIREEGKADPAPYSGDVEAGIAAFEKRIAETRAERWGNQRVSQ